MTSPVKSRNAYIDAFCFLCAILVVVIHTKPFIDTDSTMYFWFVKVLPRIAVPFFFCTTGYFFNRQLSNPAACRNQFFHLLQQYCVWSFIYIVASMFISGWPISIRNFAIDTILDFFIFGTEYHLWFIPVCLAFMIVFYILRSDKWRKFLWGCSIATYGVGVIFHTMDLYYPEALNSFISSRLFAIIRYYFLIGFPCFSMGYAVLLIEPVTPWKVRKQLPFIFALLFLGEMALYYMMGKSSSFKLTTTFMLYPLTLSVFMALHGIQKMPNLSTKFIKESSNLIYFCHPLVILLITHCWKTSHSVLCILTIVFSTAISYTIVFVKNTIRMRFSPKTGSVE